MPSRKPASKRALERAEAELYREFLTADDPLAHERDRWRRWERARDGSDDIYHPSPPPTIMPDLRSIVHPDIARGLPDELLFTRDGTIRTRIPDPSRLSEITIAEIERIRDRMLLLYAPERAREPEADVYLGVSSRASYRTGTRSWCDGDWGRFPFDCPHLRVDDRDSERIEMTRDGEIRLNNWDLSMDAWLRHLLGGISILPRWDVGVDPLTSIMIDVDYPPGQSGDLQRSAADHARVLFDAAENLKYCLGVEFEYQIMWTGNGGLWVHVHTDTPIARHNAARFVILYARLCLPYSHSEGMSLDRVRRSVAVDPSHLNAAELPLDGIFAERREKDVQVEICGGNLVTRPCRMPFARHQTSKLQAVFLHPDGEIVEDQIGYLMGIERQHLDLNVPIEAHFSRYPAGVEKRRATYIVTPGEAPQLDPDPDDPERRATYIVTPDSDATPTGFTAPRTAIPNGRWTILVSDLRRTRSLPPLPDRIPDGKMNEALIDNGGLLWVFDALSREGRLTEDAAVSMIMERYSGNEPGKEREVRGRVARGLRKGLHLMTSNSCVEIAEDAARSAGIDDRRKIDTLVALTQRGRSSGTAYCILEDLARQIGILAPMETDPRLVHNAKNVMSRIVKSLLDAGLIDRTTKGSPEHRTPSAYVLEFLKKRAEVRRAA